MANSNNSNNMVVFAGGYDGEMLEIIRVCREMNVEVIDKHLGWGASASSYAAEIAQAVEAGKTVVLVELTLDIELPLGVIVVDHHNELSTRPASLQQVLDLLGMEPTRRQSLIAANDCGYIPAMLSLGATPEEVAEVRYADRAAQGITSEQEVEAERAIAAAEVVNGVTIIRMAHSKTATVCDRLFAPEKEQRLLILSEDGESNFFGKKSLCNLLQGEKVGEQPAPWDPNQTQVLYSNFGGWTGGGEEIGFWGGYANQAEVENFVCDYFATQFVNCTPHAIVLNDGTRFEPSGQIARVSQSISDFDERGIATQTFGAVENLPEPKENTIYIVSAMVLSRAQAEGREDVVAPATGHKACVRDENNRIVSVPGFLR